MANEVEAALRSVATKVAQYIDDVATLTVETRFVEIGTNTPVDFANAQAVARTIIKLDGDSEAIIPLRVNSNGTPLPDTDLIEMHQRAVTAATEYRARILSALVDALRGLRS